MGAELGGTRRARAREVSAFREEALARRHPARTVSSVHTVLGGRGTYWQARGVRRLALPVGPVGAPRPGAALPRRLIVPLIAAFALVPAASAHAGWLPAAALDGPNADVLSVGNVDLARDGAGAVSYLKNGDGVPHAYVVAHLRRRLAGAGAHRLRRRRRRPRSRSRRATATGSRSPGSPTASSTPRSSPGGDTPGGFAPAVAARRPGARRTSTSTSASTAPPTRSGRRAATSPPRACRTRRGRAWRAPLDVDVHARGRHGRRCARASPSRPRATRSRPGASASPDGSTHVFGRRITGMNLSVAPQDLTLPGGSRGLARHRHRGRRLVRLGRLPPGHRRRLADASAGG